MMKFQKDKLEIEVYDNREMVGAAAGKDIVQLINTLLEKQAEVTIIFAAAPSQREVLKYLRETKAVDWSRVNAMHMDEYHTLDNNHSAKFGNLLYRELFSKIHFNNVYYLKENDETREEIISKYHHLLNKNKVDIVICGAGENGHIAFNDPHVARFDDKELIKEILLDETCRIQQVNDGCFASLDEVPKRAITLTIPALMNTAYIFCVVPGKLKHQAIQKLLEGEVTEDVPVSIIRTHDHATLYLDRDSYRG